MPKQSRDAYGVASVVPTQRAGILTLRRSAQGCMLCSTTGFRRVTMTGTEYWALGYLSGMLMAWLMRKTERPPRANR